MNNSPIGVFDSGLGGLNVLKELMAELPNERYIYLGDTKRFPYGQKSTEAIIEIVKENIEFLMQKGVKMIVIACGTATSQALEIVKKLYDIPIVGIIEPTVLNLRDRIEENNNMIGIIATKGTIRSCAWEKKISEYMPNAEIISEAAPLLATMAEEGWTNNKVAEYTVKEYMKIFKNVDKLILGCTHYPLFKELMQKELPRKTEIVDTGVELAKYLKKKISGYDLETSNTEAGGYEIYLTDVNEDFANGATSILSDYVNISEINKVEL